ncbi:LOW QUALITY PROTEIN: Gag protein, partial [Phytophthora palmivora]
MDRGGGFPHLTDAPFESIRKMVGIFGGDALRSLAAATPAEQVERIEAFDTYERGLIAHVQGLQAPVAEMKPAQPKPLRLKVTPMRERRETTGQRELAMDAALISTERLRVAFALSNLGGRAKTWAYTREATTPGCFTTWAQLCEQLRTAFLPANYEYRQRLRLLACKQGKCELHEYIQEMRILAASLVRNPLPEHIKVMVFMDDLKVDPSRAQLFRIALQEEYSHRQARTPTSVWQGHNASSGAVQGAPAAGASTEPVPMELGTAVQSSIRCYGCGKLGHMQRAYPAGGQRKFPSKPRGSRGPWHKPRPKSQGNWGHQSADGARHGGLAPESLGALEMRKSSGGLLVVHASVRGYGYPFIILIDSGAVTNFARRQTVSVRLADGTVVSVPGVRMDLAVTFEDFDRLGSFLVLDMDKYDLILGMPWLEKHEPWIDIGASRPAVSDRALVSNVPTSVRDWGARDGRLGACAPEEVLGVTNFNEGVAMSLTTGHETKAHCQ